MAFSIQTAVSNGTLTTLAVTLDYYKRNDISVYFDGVPKLTGWGWVGTTDKTIVFSPAVPAGVTVRVVRSTDLDAVKHLFANGAKFKATSVDSNFKQLLHLVQEITESRVPLSVIGGLNMAGEKVVNLAPGVNGGDAVNKAQMDTAILEGSGAGVVVENVGNFGAGVFKEKFGSTLRLRKIQAGANVTVTEGTDTVTISASGGSLGEANTASNVGTGAGVFQAKTGVNLALKSLRAGANVTITPGADDILISADSAVSVRGLNVAPVWSALSWNTTNKPVILSGMDASSATPTISFGRTMANNNTVVIVQPIGVQQASQVYSPLLTGVTTTGFTISKDVISPTTKGVANYAVYWVAIGEEA